MKFKKNELSSSFFMKILVVTTCIPFLIIYSVYNLQKDNFSFDFVRKTEDKTNLILKSLVIESKSSPDQITAFENHVFINFIEEKQIQSLLIDTNFNLIGKKAIADTFNLILSINPSKGRINAIDQRRRQFINFNITENVYKKYSIPLFDRGIAINDSIVLLSSIDTLSHDKLFFRYNVFNNQASKLNVPLPVIGDYGFRNDGFFSCSNESNKTVYFLYHIGEFIVIDNPNGKITSRNTIDKYNFKPIIVEKSGVFYKSRKTKKVNFAGAVNSKYIFVLSNMNTFVEKSSNSRQKYIDLYDSKYPHYYIKSIYFSKDKIRGIVDMFANDKYLYLLSGGQIVIIDSKNI